MTYNPSRSGYCTEYVIEKLYLCNHFTFFMLYIVLVFLLIKAFLDLQIGIVDPERIVAYGNINTRPLYLKSIINTDAFVLWFNLFAGLRFRLPYYIQMMVEFPRSLLVAPLYCVTCKTHYWHPTDMNICKYITLAPLIVSVLFRKPNVVRLYINQTNRFPIMSRYLWK